MTEEKINLWEEKNLTEVLKKYENNGVLDGRDITKNIQIKSNDENLKDITIEKWKRSCPKCNKELTYKTKWRCLNAENKKYCCAVCRQIGINHFIPHRKKKFPNGREYTRSCPRCKSIIKYKDRKGLWFGIKRNYVCKDCRKSDLRIKFCNKKQFMPSYNPNACLYFDKLNESNSWNLQHALNGGEIKFEGYWLDAYDKQKNIVVEYDEYHHFKNGQLKEKDLDRMNYIKNKLGCRFFRYDERNNKLKEF